MARTIINRSWRVLALLRGMPRNSARIDPGASAPVCCSLGTLERPALARNENSRFRGCDRLASIRLLTGFVRGALVESGAPTRLKFFRESLLIGNFFRVSGATRLKTGVPFFLRDRFDGRLYSNLNVE